NILEELKDIVIERDDTTKDKFHKLIEDAEVVDIEGPHDMEYFFKEISRRLGKILQMDTKYLFDKFIEREKESSTVISEGLSIPHIVVEGKHVFKILLARAKTGIIFPDDKVVHIIFVLVGSTDERNLHLKALSAIAQITQEPRFYKRWFRATDKEELKTIVLLAERRRF
ncbi:PTS sugar transporter subunit IIA, partial [Candidatus Omnitrophota bacterium]